LFGRTRKEETCVSEFGYSFGDIRDQIRELHKIVPRILIVLGPIFLAGKTPRAFDLHYKAHLDTDHAAVSRRSAEGARRSRDEKIKK